MAVLVDTCGWIEWLTEGVLAEDFGPYLNNPEDLVVPTALQFELYKWTKRERDEQVALETVALTEQAKVIPFTQSLALYAADLSLRHQMSFADSIMYATARQADVTLVTSDDHFQGMQEVVFIPKPKTG